MRAVWNLHSDGPSSPTNLRKTFRSNNKRKYLIFLSYDDVTRTHQYSMNTSLYSSWLLIMSEWMQENQQPGDQISTSRNNMHWQQNLFTKERYGTALPILGMFYVIYLSKWDVFGNEKSWIISFGKSSACAGCSSDYVSFSLLPGAPVNQMLSSYTLTVVYSFKSWFWYDFIIVHHLMMVLSLLYCYCYYNHY